MVNRWTLLLFATVALASAELDFSNFESFAANLASSESIQRIEVGLELCREGDVFGASELAKIQWTVEPLLTDSNNINISTSILLSSQQPGLVEALVDPTTGILSFRSGIYLNIYRPGGTGVRIQVPPQQLKVFATVGRAFSARVLPGFTNLTDVKVDSIASSVDVQVLDEATTNAGIVSPLVVSGTGESNVIRIGNDAIDTTTANHVAKLDFGGRFNGIFVFGSTIGVDSNLSCSDCTLYADEPIEELTVEGKSTGVTTKVGCDNVEITAEAAASSTCRELGADNAMDFEFEGMDEDDSAVSTTIFTFGCGSTSAAVQQYERSGFYSHGGVALAAFLWYTLF